MWHDKPKELIAPISRSLLTPGCGHVQAKCRSATVVDIRHPRLGNIPPTSPTKRSQDAEIPGVPQMQPATVTLLRVTTSAQPVDQRLIRADFAIE